MSIHRVYAIFQRRFRGKRNELFVGTLKPSRDDRILDVGGYARFWADVPCDSEITCLNVDPPEREPDDEAGRVTYMQGDGRRLPFADHAYDIVFSNSVIEHVGSLDEQRRFASEVRRVGRAYWVQTPNRWFFVEPHLVAPFVHFLPRALQRKLLRRMTIWGIVAKPTQDQIDTFLRETRLLTRGEMATLFPDATLVEERFLFFAKSFVAYRLAARSA